MEKLKQQLSFAQLTIERSGDPIMWIGEDARVIYANEAACRRLGYDQQEILGLSVPDIDPLFPPDAWQSHWDEVKAKKVVRLESVHKSRDGETYPVSITTSYMVHGDTEILCGFIRDISERKSAERALIETQDRLRAIIEAEPECVKLLDKGGHLLEINAAGLAMIEADSFEQVSGQCIYPFIIAEYRDAFAAMTDKVFQGQAATLQFELVGFRGGHRWLETHSVPLYDPYDKAKIDSLLAVTRDVTEQKLAEENLRRFAAELSEANRLKDVFTDVLRHDILNPVTEIRLTTEVLIEMESDERKTKMLQRMIRSVDTIVATAEDAARHASVTAGRALEFFESDPVAVLRTVLPDFEHRLLEKNISLVDQCGPGFGARFNPMIKEVFANLISNAIKYSPNDTRIDVFLEDEGQSWIFSVKDEGVGVPDEFKKTVFNRFERLGREGVKGTGLGLSITKQLVSLHRGEIWIEDNPSGGSIFRVRIPKTQGPD